MHVFILITRLIKNENIYNFFLLFLNTKSKFTIQLFEIDREMGKSVCVVFLVGGEGGGVETYKIKENEPTVFHSREMQGNTV